MCETQLSKLPRWVCEYCFRIFYGRCLPDDWDFVWQSAVCPVCKERAPKDGGYFVIPGGKYATGPDPRGGDKGASPTIPFPADPPPIGDLIAVEANRIAAGKKLCGMCFYRAANEWRCTNITRGPFASPAQDPAGGCEGFLQKKSPVKKLHQSKKKGLPVDPDAKFLYFGRPPGGVVTVAYIIVEKSHRIEISFAFTNMGDPKKGIRPDLHDKREGRNQANARLGNHYLTVPFLYDAKKTVQEVVRAVLKHDWRVLFGIASYVQSDLRPFQRSVPGWTKDLAKRMEAGERVWRLLMPRPRRLVLRPSPFPAITEKIMHRMMADIAKVGE